MHVCLNTVVACQILIKKSGNSVKIDPYADQKQEITLCGLITWSNRHAVKPLFFPSVPQTGLCICHLWMSERNDKVYSTILHAVKERQELSVNNISERKGE